MRITSNAYNLKRLALLQGLYVGLSPLAFVLYEVVSASHLLQGWTNALPFTALVLMGISVLYPFEHWANRRIYGTSGILVAAVPLQPIIIDRPEIALSILLILAIAFFTLFEEKSIESQPLRLRRYDRYNISIKSSIFSFTALQATLLVSDSQIGIYTIVSSVIVFCIIVVVVAFYNVFGQGYRNPISIFNILWSIVLIALVVTYPTIHYVAYILLSVFLFSIPIYKRDNKFVWWLDYALDKPARALFSMFLAAGFVGSVLLYLPVSQTLEVSWLDTFFTAVSAVCVTGLIVVDTPVVYSFWGQLIILILIQLGGLGIMSVSIILLQRLGKRISISQEHIVASITDSDKSSIYSSIQHILIFTLIAELLGALLLSVMFILDGEGVGTAIWRGIFTSISAFCNAGFALQSDSLMSYASNSGILIIVSTLIVVGGISPLSTMMIFRKKSHKTLSAALKLSLIVVAALLIIGTMGTLLFEWNGSLSSLSTWDKIVNAWFQSVTLRTAGFNTIDQALLSTPVYLMSMMWMVIGGSPGGTAGGVKTAVFGLIILNFISLINQKSSLTFAGRTFPSEILLKAVSITTAYVFMLICALMAMYLTQNIPFNMLLFEVTSALSTVGLSMGATNMVDPLGKWMLICTMFIGRLGVVTIFMLISKEKSEDRFEYPQEQMTLA